MILPLIFMYPQIYKYSMYSSGNILYTWLCRYFSHLLWNLFCTSAVSLRFRTCFLFLSHPKVAFCCTVWLYQTLLIQWSIRGPLGCLFWYYKPYYCECPYESTCSHKREFISTRSSWKRKGLGKRHRHREHFDCPSPLPSAGGASLLSTQQHWEHSGSMLLYTRRCCSHQSTLDGVVLCLQLFLPLREASYHSSISGTL